MRTGKRKIYTLAYADYVALLFEDEKEMKRMMGRLKRYLKQNGLELNK